MVMKEGEERGQGEAFFESHGSPDMVVQLLEKV